MAKNTAASNASSDPASTTASNADVADLDYEVARDELAAIVAKLESGSPTIEESMKLWERGEVLAAHCQGFLDTAEERIKSMTAGEVSEAAERS